MNVYALAPLGAFVINFAAMVYVGTRGVKHPLRRDYFVFSAFVGCWCFSDFLLWTPLSEPWAYLVLRLQPLMYFPAVFMLLQFAYTLAERRADIWYWAALFATMLASVFGVATPWISADVQTVHWGMQHLPGPLFVPSVAVAILPAFLRAVQLVVIDYHRRQQAQERAQRGLILVGITLPVLLGLASNVVWPVVFGFNEVLELGAVGTVIFPIFIVRALAKYDFMTVSLESVALSLFDQVEDGLMLFDPHRRCVDLNPAGARMLGHSPEALRGKLFERLLPGVTPGEGLQEVQLPWATAGGSVGHFTVTQAPYYRHQTCLGWLVIVHNVSEVRQARQAQWETEERFRFLADSLPQPVFESDENFRLTYLNRAGRRMFGYAEEEVEQGLALENLLRPRDLKDLYDKTARQTAGEPCEPSSYDVVCADGKNVPVLMHSVPRFIYGNPAGMCGIIVDNTEQRDKEERLLEDRSRLEQQLRQAQRMEAVNRLAVSAAEDFGHVFSTVGQNVKALKKQVSARRGTLKLLDEALAATAKGRRLVRQLRVFAKKQELQVVVVDVNSVVEDFQGMISRVAAAEIAFHLSLEPTLWTVRADVVQLEQVLMNLVVNAMEAMPKGGRISLSTKNATIDEMFVAHHPCATPGDFVMVQVRDRGKGIDKAVMSKIFEPYFSTKAPADGIGFGLATAYGIVQQHGGFIAVESSSGRGTTFFVYLPRAQGPGADEILPRPSNPPVPRLEGKTVLIVEDHREVLQLADAMLSRHGYQTIPAATGTAAQEALVNFEGIVDLVLADVLLPDMNGTELLSIIEERRPDCAVLFMSGHDLDTLAQSAPGVQDWPLLQKPFSLGELLWRVAEMLESSPDGREVPLAKE